MRLILSLVNSLQTYGGKAQYVKWEEGVGISSSNDSFFFDPSIQTFFKNYITVLSELEFTIERVKVTTTPDGRVLDLFFITDNLGMIYIGVKKCGKALELFLNVVASSMSTLSSIAVEAYKMYILVSLIHIGQFKTHFPKYTSPLARRCVKNFPRSRKQRCELWQRTEFVSMLWLLSLAKRRCEDRTREVGNAAKARILR